MMTKWLDSFWCRYHELIHKIHTLAVKHKFQRQGVGRTLLRRVFELTSLSDRMKFIYLWVRQGNDVARELYVRCDFGETKMVMNKYRAGVNRTKMEKRLRKIWEISKKPKKTKKTNNFKFCFHQLRIIDFINHKVL